MAQYLDYLYSYTCTYTYTYTSYAFVDVPLNFAIQVNLLSAGIITRAAWLIVRVL